MKKIVPPAIASINPKTQVLTKKAANLCCTFSGQSGGGKTSAFAQNETNKPTTAGSINQIGSHFPSVPAHNKHQRNAPIIAEIKLATFAIVNLLGLSESPDMQFC